MSKIPYKSKLSSDGEDDIVSFEAFCGGGSASEGGVGRLSEMSLNDNINYRLYYEREGAAATSGAARDAGEACEKETSLCGARPSSTGGKRKSSVGFTLGRGGKSTLLGSAAGRPRDGGGAGVPGYRRFSERRAPGDDGEVDLTSVWRSLRSGVVVVAVLVAACVAVWWGVAGAVGDAWSEEHYRRLWERAHPDRAHHLIVHHDVEPAVTPPNFHDHNNLSTKNRQNASESGRKKSREGATGDSCSSVKDELRFDCFPQDGATEQLCRQRGCCWIPKEVKSSTAHSIGLPYCFYPPRHRTYKFANMTETRRGLSVYYELQKPSPYPGDFRVAHLEIIYLSDDAMHVKITDGEHARFEPPYPELAMVPHATTAAPLYRVLVEPQRVGFKLLRTADNTTLLDTQDVGGLVLSDRVLQLSTLLPTHSLYGLGERRGPLQLSTEWTRHTMFNYDSVPIENSNLYGSHPFYLALEESGKSHGVLMFNSNAMDVVLQPAPALTWRTSGGVLQLLVVLGPTPGDVVAQYTGLVGRPAMPPYWALGFHLCKYNYGSLNVTREVWKRTRDAGIPFDVQWNDLDYMERGNDFTIDKQLYAGLPEFVQELHDSGYHYVPLIDPGVSASEPHGSYQPYDVGRQMEVFIANSSGLPFVGKVWNRESTVWPDFTHPNASSYWLQMLHSLHKQVEFDGAWIDMNEPSNFLSGPLGGRCSPDDAPFTPHVAGGTLNAHTVCMEARHHAGAHADLHNLHALTEAIATHFALSEIRGKRPLIISRASSPGLGRYAGHWSGDIASEWHDMRMTIPELLSFSLFGVPLMGADICGFRGNTTVELCKRWMQLGAFYPFSRNHNSDTSSPQDPVTLGEEVVAASRASLRMRYTLLPYLYTLFWDAHTSGNTVARPLFFEFPLDRVTHTIDTQFLLGPAVMVVPVLQPGVSSVRAYLPRQLWYALNGTRVVPFVGWGELNENETVLIKGGSALLLQPPDERGAVTTAATRGRPLHLLVAPCDMRRARGQIYWDDGDDINSWSEKKYSWIEVHHEMGSVRSAVRWWGWGVPSVERILLMNQDPPREVTLQGALVKYSYCKETRLLSVYDLKLALDVPFELVWH